MAKNTELLSALGKAFPQLFSVREENGETREVLDLEKIRVLLGDGNYRDKYGLCWENKPEQFDADSVGKLPTLKHVSELSLHNDLAKPTHVLIEGDNYHALQVLAYTHARSVDVIYIDPPYNTGNKDFKYNDRFVDKEDGYRHSKWLSFMAKRLKLAKTLLKDTGVLLVSIDENEFAQLKLLSDEIFGEKNFIAELIWDKTRKNNVRFFSVGHEQILVFAKSRADLEQTGVVWREEKGGLKELLDKYFELRATLGDDYAAIETDLRAWHKSLAKDHPSKGFGRCLNVDKRGPWRDDNISAPGGGGGRYDVLHDVTGLPCEVPERGWCWSQVTMQEKIKEGFVKFRADHTEPPIRKKHLLVTTEDGDTDLYVSVMPSVISRQAQVSVNQLRDIFGTDVFNNPKDYEVIARLIGYVTNRHKRAVVVDFFAGSGTTAHAVMRLNMEDGGSRQCILVTNDEGEFKDDNGAVLPGGICTHVTYPRLKKVIEGYTTPKGSTVAGFGENLEFLRTGFHAIPKTKGQTRAFAKACVPLLELKAGCFQLTEESAAWRLYKSNDKHLFVLLDDMAGEDALERLRTVGGPVDAYVFAYEQDDDTSALLSTLPNVSIQEVPKPILDLFQRLQGKA